MIHETWLAFPAGILISTVVSSIGLGGGILWMPFFLIILKLRPEIAVLTSLLIQTAGMGSGALAFFRQKRVDHRLALFLLLIAVPGITAGAHLAKRVDASHIEIILGILVMTTAFLFVSSNEKYDDLGEPKAEIRKAWRYSWVTMLASVVSGMLSISMSEWLIPMMRSKLSLRMSIAIGTCIFITFGTCVIGSSVHLLIGGKANFSVVLWGVPGVIIGGQIGPRITTKIDERLLKEIFIFLLTLVGIHLIYNSY
ncbi:sulfite exporter TauE/SafE family protein [Desulfonema magnum]|uniref:Probable membrane transporter protein n=1 Tax=Desulfonema magnum TaxID=45655 RepID=A0A975GS69_9BACT|nr:sulfite exporter TauE/SafE family protein [Desulfonema magnum]QTA90778.1 Putative sulfite/organosulfonate ABC transporter, permease protein [Desulfonema magnum]